MPDEAVHELVVNRLGIGVMVQLKSYGLNPLPDMPTKKPGVTELGLSVIWAEGVPTWKVVPAKNPFESVTLTT